MNCNKKMCTVYVTAAIFNRYEIELVCSLKTHDIHTECCLCKTSLTSFHKVTKEVSNNQAHTY